MKEDFVQFVWENLLFDFSNLQTTQGTPVVIRKPGRRNVDQGPDFNDAWIKIGHADWFGKVEIHLTSQDWYRHKHHEDPKYNAVVLHVVFQSDGSKIIREDGSEIEEISLSGRVSEAVIQRHDSLNFSGEKLPCGNMIHEIPEIIIWNWVEGLGIQRIKHKAERIQRQTGSLVGNWEQSLWEEIAAYIGGKVNQSAFRELARAAPIRILKKHFSNQVEIESILMGVAGMLSKQGPTDDFHSLLMAEWQYFQKKYELHTCYSGFNLLRMRPVSFPHLRISQLASFIGIFPEVTSLLNKEGIELFLKSAITGNAYWKTHYTFFKESVKHSVLLGREKKEILLINAVLPMSLLYAQSHGRLTEITRIVDTLSELSAENNRITRLFSDLGMHPENALRSQGILRLKQDFCDEKKCLNCALGQKLLNSNERKQTRSNHWNRC